MWQTRASAAARRTVTRRRIGENLAQWYVASADRILEAYRTSPDPWLYEFDWPKAEICLERAVQLGAARRSYAGEAGAGSRVRDAGAAERRALFGERRCACCGSRRATSSCWPRSRRRTDPAPHLALARVYVYSLPDPEKAMAEFAAAERRGAVLGRREVEQQGDVYRIRAQQELARDWRRAMRDADVARGFYRAIPGFDEADRHLRALDRIHRAGAAQAASRGGPTHGGDAQLDHGRARRP